MKRDEEADGGAIDMAPADPAQLAWCEMSDLGNAERLKARRGRDLVYVEGWGWGAFDGTCWTFDNGSHLASLAAHDVAKMIRREVEALAADDYALPDWCSEDMRADRILNLRKWAVKSGDASRTAAMLTQAQHLLATDRARFDRDAFALNVLNGTLRIVRHEGKVLYRLDPHDPEDRITKCCAVLFCPPGWKAGKLWNPEDFDEKACCPKWSGLLDKAMPKPRVRSFLQEIVGYGFTGSTREQMAFFHQGKGGDGKSTALQGVLLNLAGSYGAKVDVKTFLAGPDKSGADASPDIFRLQGDVRYICMEEPKRGQALDEAKMKAFTGGGRMTARAPYGRDIVEFVPRGKLLLECNAKPRIPGADDGIWRRIVVIPWPHQFKGSERVKAFEEHVAEELWAVLLWVLVGQARWIERGELVPPPEVQEAVEDYRRSANPFGEWYGERVDTSDPLAQELSATLYGDYKDWCEANSVDERERLSSTKFGIMMGDMQHLKWKGGDGKVRRRGAKLRDRMARAAAAVASEPVPGWDDDLPA